MAAWLNDWVAGFAARTPGAVPTATVFAEPGRRGLPGGPLSPRGARVVKVHVQVGGFDPRDADPSTAPGGCSPRPGFRWSCTAATVRCPGPHTGLQVFEEVLRSVTPGSSLSSRTPACPTTTGALALVARYPRVHLDTTMVGTAFTEALRAAAAGLGGAARGCRATGSCSGSDFPNIPYPYGEQLDAIHRWSRAPGLGRAFLRAVLRENGLRLLAAEVVPGRGGLPSHHEARAHGQVERLTQGDTCCN